VLVPKNKNAGKRRMTKIKKKNFFSNNKLNRSRKDSKLKSEVIFRIIIVKVLETSGILDAYEYFLRAICKNGLP